MFCVTVVIPVYRLGVCAIEIIDEGSQLFFEIIMADKVSVTHDAFADHSVDSDTRYIRRDVCQKSFAITKSSWHLHQIRTQNPRVLCFFEFGTASALEFSNETS